MIATPQDEFQIDGGLHRTVPPRVPLPACAAQVSALTIPAKEVGGDFYDCFLFQHEGDVHLGVVVADVSGKGRPAARFMAAASALLKRHALRLRDPAAAMARLNDRLCQDNEHAMFLTAFLGVLNLRTGHLAFVNAGHNPPVILSAGRARWLHGPRNVVLGARPGLAFRPGAVRLGPGDRLFLYTDGVTEAIGPGFTMFGGHALLDALHDGQRGIGSLPERVLGAVRRFAGDQPQADDITCVAVEFRGAA